MAAQYWLVRVATRAGLPNAERLDVRSGTAVADAWKQVAATCHVDSDTLAGVVAKAFLVPVANLRKAEPTAVKLLPASTARKHGVLPLRDRERQLIVATADPTNIDAQKDIGFASGRTPSFEVAPPDPLQRAIDAAYSIDGTVENLLRLVDHGQIELVADESTYENVKLEDTASPPVVRLANAIIFEAIRLGASDVHLQPTSTGGIVRNRVDGVLRTGMRVPLPVFARVISRIKVIARLDIADHIRPQDGHMHVSVSGREYDLRISTVPTRDAEKCVIRILDPNVSRTLDEIGLPAQEMELFRRQLRRRDGVVVVTGPTGSGKTTTLYGALREVATEDVNAMTVEDPIEYELAGLTQIPVEPKRGVTFASALRAILRQDPDIIFVGEIRDPETAEVAVQASLTGHLVLTTLHTNEALGAILRLSDLGVEPAAITQTLRASMAQRLLRRVCPECSEPVGDQLTPNEQRLSTEYGSRPRMRARGCERCSQSGYRGRVPIVELFVMNPALERLILSGASFADLTTAAAKAGMRTMREVALERVRNGETTLEEVERVLGEPSGFEPSARVLAPTVGATTVDAAADGDAAGPSEIFVVDDDFSTRLIARALLEREGYRVSEAKDGREALDILATDPGFTLMVLDLEMPHIGGRDVLKALRDSAATAALPVIVLTGTPDPEAEIELLQQGADDYLRKPLDPARFLTRVKAVLRRANG